MLQRLRLFVQVVLLIVKCVHYTTSEGERAFWNIEDARLKLNQEIEYITL